MKALALFQIQLKDILKNLQVCLLFFVFPVIGFVMSSSMQDQSSFFISVFATMHVVFTPMMTMSTILAEQKEQKIIRNLAYAGVPSSLYLLVHGVLVCFLTCFTACLFLVFPGFSLDVIPFLTAVFTGVILSILQVDVLPCQHLPYLPPMLSLCHLPCYFRLCLCLRISMNIWIIFQISCTLNKSA